MSTSTLNMEQMTLNAKKAATSTSTVVSKKTTEVVEEKGKITELLYRREKFEKYALPSSTH